MYLRSTEDYIMVGYVGDMLQELTAHLFVDSSFASCPYTLKSTNGAAFNIQGPNTCFPIAALSKQQEATAHSSTEAELGAADKGVRTQGEPAIIMLEVIVGKGTQKSRFWILWEEHGDGTGAARDTV